MLFSPALKHALLLILSSTSLVASKPFEHPRQDAKHDLLSRGAIAQGANLRILCLGASITYGYESTSGNGYRYALRGALVNDGNTVNMVGSLTHGTMKNNQVEGWEGFRIEQVAQKAELSLPLMPNVVLINAGLNDAGQNYNVATAHLRMGTLVDRIFQVVPNAAVIVSTLLPNTNPATQANIDIINGNFQGMVASRAAAGKKVSLVDMSSGFIATDDLQADGSHPTDEGYLKMAKVFYNGVVAMSGRISSPALVNGVNDFAAQSDAGAGAALNAACQGVSGQLAVQVDCVASTTTTTAIAEPPSSAPTTTAIPEAPKPAVVETSAQPPTVSTTTTPPPPPPVATTAPTSVRLDIPSVSSEAPSSSSEVSPSTSTSSTSDTSTAAGTVTLTTEIVTPSSSVLPTTVPVSTTTTSQTPSTTSSSHTSSSSSSLTSRTSTSSASSSLTSKTSSTTAVLASLSSPTPTHKSGASSSFNVGASSFIILFTAILACGMAL